MGIKEAAVSDARSNTILSMPYAPCPMPHAPCPMPHAPLPIFFQTLIATPVST
jgi:hypothetical protein